MLLVAIQQLRALLFESGFSGPSDLLKSSLFLCWLCIPFLAAKMFFSRKAVDGQLLQW